MSYDHTQQPEYAGAMTEPRPPHGDRWPEAGGPMLDGQALAQGYGARTVTIGQPPHLLPPEVRDRERAEVERKAALRQRVKDAALAAAASAMEASTITAQVFADVDQAVEKAVAAAPVPEEVSS
jgi:hypothetical protein